MAPNPKKSTGAPFLLESVHSVASDLGLLIRHEFEDMISYELDACVPGNVEAVHQMRVGTRRLRTILRVTRPLMKEREAREFRREFRRLAGLLGDVRDHDVFLEWLAEHRESAPKVHHEALDRLSDEVSAVRTRKHEALARALAGERHQTFVAEFREFLTHAELHLPEAAQETIGRAVRRLQRDRRRAKNLLQNLKGKKPSPEDFHKLRIHFKRLRYLLEFVSGMLPASRARAWKRQTRYFTRLQRLLGDLHDRDVFIARLEAGSEAPAAGARYRDPGHIARQWAIRTLRVQRDKLEEAARELLT